MTLHFTFFAQKMWYLSLLIMVVDAFGTQRTHVNASGLLLSSGERSHPWPNFKNMSCVSLLFIRSVSALVFPLPAKVLTVSHTV